MLTKTHIAISILAILLFINSVENKIIFSIVVLIATLIPDVDSNLSGVGRKVIFRPLQFFVRHRGVLHSFTFLILISLVFVLFFPIVAFGFFLGYGLHLLADSFTIEGIRPFYPFKKTSSWKIRTGGKTEIMVLIVFIIADLAMVVLKVWGLF